MITNSDFINLSERLKELHLSSSTGISFLPYNIENATSKEDLVYENSVKTLRTLLRNNSIPEERIDQPEDNIPYRQLNYFEWLGPIVFFSSSVVSDNPHLVSVTLGVISNYVTDFFKGISGSKKVTLDIVVEKTKNREYKKFHYEGDPEGLKDFVEIVKNI